MYKADASSDVIREMRARVRARRLELRDSGDRPRLARLEAMEAVLATGFLPFACPDAIAIAGDAAAAAASGLTEPEWYAKAITACNADARERTRLEMAVRLLRAADFWPWRFREQAEANGVYGAALPSVPRVPAPDP